MKSVRKVRKRLGKRVRKGRKREWKVRKAMKVKNLESQESKLKHENFCHHANPAFIHSNQAESD